MTMTIRYIGQDGRSVRTDSQDARNYRERIAAQAAARRAAREARTVKAYDGRITIDLPDGAFVETD